jgi:uncharacterized membrane protein
VFAFATVAMPGIQNLGDRDFLRAFKAMDLVIQRNQPVFMLVWVGSVVALAIAALLSFWQLDGVERLFTILAAVVYVFGVQSPTATVNVPLNNKLQALDIDEVNDSSIRQARKDFEHRWLRWNSIRTVFAVVTSALLIVLLLRI